MRINTAGFGMVPQNVRETAKRAVAWLEQNGIPCCIVGGMAVGCYAKPRMTNDVDILVRDQDLPRVRDLGEARPLMLPTQDGLTVTLGGTDVDFLTVPQGMPESILMDVQYVDDMPVVRAEALVGMKLDAGRLKDLADVVEVLKTRSSEERAQIRKWVRRESPHNLEDLDQAVLQADIELSPPKGRRTAGFRRQR